MGEGYRILGYIRGGSDMRVGSLVQFGHEWCDDTHIGVVVGYWTHDVSEEEHTLVYWIIGKYVGDTDAILVCDLEVLCE